MTWKQVTDVPVGCITTPVQNFVIRNPSGSVEITGNTHRMSINYASTLLGHSNVAAMSGWLGDPKYASYMKPSKRKDWCTGFTVGYMESNGTVHLQLVPFINYRAVVGGRLVTL